MKDAETKGVKKSSFEGLKGRDSARNSHVKQHHHKHQPMPKSVVHREVRGMKKKERKSVKTSRSSGKRSVNYMA